MQFGSKSKVSGAAYAHTVYFRLFPAYESGSGPGRSRK